MAQMLQVTTEQEALGGRDGAEILRGSVPLLSQELETRSSPYRDIQLAKRLGRGQGFCCGKRSQAPGNNCVSWCRMLHAATIKKVRF